MMGINLKLALLIMINKIRNWFDDNCGNLILISMATYMALHFIAVIVLTYLMIVCPDGSMD